MKNFKSIFVAGLAVASLFVANAAIAGEKTGNGGIFVKVKGQWVQIDEARNYLERDYIGIKELIRSDCEGEAGCQTNFGKALRDHLEAIKTVQPELYAKIYKNANLIQFRVVDKELAYVPKDLPQSTEMDLKEYKKAAIYRSEDGLHGVVWVSIPVMKMAGSLGPGRLTARQNQGHLMFHEMLNLLYAKDATWSAQKISDYGVAILEALYEKRSEVDLVVYLQKTGFDMLRSDVVSDNAKLNAIIQLHEENALEKVPPFNTNVFVAPNVFESAKLALGYKNGIIHLDYISDPVQASSTFNSMAFLTTYFGLSLLKADSEISKKVFEVDLPKAIVASDLKVLVDTLVTINRYLTNGVSFDIRRGHEYVERILSIIRQSHGPLLEKLCADLPAGWSCTSETIDFVFSRAWPVTPKKVVANKWKGFGGRYHRKVRYSEYLFDKNSNQLVHYVNETEVLDSKDDPRVYDYEETKSSVSSLYSVDPKTGKDKGKLPLPYAFLSVVKEDKLRLPPQYVPVEKK